MIEVSAFTQELLSHTCAHLGQSNWCVCRCIIHRIRFKLFLQTFQDFFFFLWNNVVRKEVKYRYPAVPLGYCIGELGLCDVLCPLWCFIPLAAVWLAGDEFGVSSLPGGWKGAATAVVSSGHKVLLSYLLFLASPKDWCWVATTTAAGEDLELSSNCPESSRIALTQLHPSNPQQGFPSPNDLAMSEGNTLPDDDATVIW